MSGDPVLIAYAVKRGKQGRVIYERIGRAYPHNAGAGLTLRLDAWPMPGYDIVLLELDSADDRRLLAQAKRLSRTRNDNGRLKKP
jgi:hypothetical protein